MEKILEILENIRPDSDFRNSPDFISDVLLDSFDIMTLVAELEEEFGVKISDTDIIPENFASIDAMMALIESNYQQKL